MITGFWDRETFVENLRAIGVRGYHDKHPFHVMMNEGRLSPRALRGWVANRFYYQRNIPIKDAAILANCPVREVRRAWIYRILDHDGTSVRGLETPGETDSRELAPPSLVHAPRHFLKPTSKVRAGITSALALENPTDAQWPRNGSAPRLTL